MISAMLEIQALYSRYADLIDEGPIAEWPSLFTDDAILKVVTRENVEHGWALALMSCESRAAIEDRVYAIENLSMTIPRRYRHLVSGITAVPNGAQGWNVTANFAVFETIEGQPTAAFAAGRYKDVIVREKGALRFREKISIADAASIKNSLVFPL
ncbi:MAG TPA: nuclear transport factor 2 family protein [Rhizomicrobium sp.]|nr:nuclear transport factor 2 family protein [Rhizomicrobium sp.]